MTPPETLSIRTLLGVRCVDAATKRPVKDGLRVVARPLTGGGPRVEAFRTTSGTFAFQGLPGLRRLEYPERERGLAPETGEQDFIIEITDDAHRFLPLAQDVPVARTEATPALLDRIQAINEVAGLSLRDVRGPSSGSGGPHHMQFDVDLVSAPARSVPPGTAVVRCQLLDADGEPARHAVLEVQYKTTHVQVGAIEHRQGDVDEEEVQTALTLEEEPETHVGLSDSRGQVLVLFPYPPPPLTTRAALPDERLEPALEESLEQKLENILEPEAQGEGPIPRLAVQQAFSHAVDQTLERRALLRLTWEVTLRVRYQPDSVSILPGASYPAWSRLMGQEAGTIQAVDDAPVDPPVGSLPAQLRYGQPLMFTLSVKPKSP